MGGEDESDRSRSKVKISETSQSSTGSATSTLDPATYVNKISNVTNQVAGRLGNVLGKGLGGLGGKLGGPSSWFWTSHLAHPSRNSSIWKSIITRGLEVLEKAETLQLFVRAVAV